MLTWMHSPGKGITVYVSLKISLVCDGNKLMGHVTDRVKKRATQHRHFSKIECAIVGVTIVTTISGNQMTKKV